MRRRYAVAFATAALAGGLVASGPAGGQSGCEARYEVARTQMERSLAAYRHSVVYRVFDRRPATLKRLRGEVARFDRAVTTMQTLEASGEAPVRDPQEIEDLREAQEHMDDYLDAFVDDDRMGMQISTWRFLWVLNRLPLSR